MLGTQGVNNRRKQFPSHGAAGYNRRPFTATATALTGVLMSVEPKYTLAERSTAYHEAGHAVMAHVLGLRVISATIVAAKGYLGVVRFGKTGITENASYARPNSTWVFDRKAMVSMAGMIGEVSVLSHRNHVGAGADATGLAWLAVDTFGNDETGRAWLVYLWHRDMDELVNVRHWPMVDSLAHALLERRTLADGEVLEAMSSTKPADRNAREPVSNLRAKLHAMKCPFLYQSDRPD